MLIIGTEILVQLQSFLNNFLFEGIFETVIAIIVGFCAVKLSRRIIGSLLGVYLGLILGGILGYIIGRNLVWICCGAIAVALIFLALCNLIKRGSDFMIAFIFFMSVAYVLIKLLLDVFDIEFYSLFNNYSQDKVEYLTRDIVLGVSLVFGIVGALVAVKLKYGEKLYLVFCSFIGVLQLIGLYENFVGAQIDMSQGSWEDFFIPLLHMEYNFRGQGIILAGVMIVGSFILYIIQSVILNDNRED